MRCPGSVVVSESLPVAGEVITKPSLRSFWLGEIISIKTQFVIVGRRWLFRSQGSIGCITDAAQQGSNQIGKDDVFQPLRKAVANRLEFS
jgi:hypothetical protein